MTISHWWQKYKIETWVNAVNRDINFQQHRQQRNDINSNFSSPAKQKTSGLNREFSHIVCSEFDPSSVSTDSGSVETEHVLIEHVFFLSMDSGMLNAQSVIY